MFSSLIDLPHRPYCDLPQLGCRQLRCAGAPSEEGGGGGEGGTLRPSLRAGDDLGGALDNSGGDQVSEKGFFRLKKYEISITFEKIAPISSKTFFQKRHY